MQQGVAADGRLGLGGGVWRWWSPPWWDQSITNSLDMISSGWLELRWWRNPPPATERQHVASSLETRLASVHGGPERRSLERALASAAISTALVAGDLDTVLDVGGR